MVNIERISTGVHLCGEGPHWNADTQSLYYVDAVGQNIYRWDERLQKETKIHIPSDPSPPSPSACFNCFVIGVRGRPDHFVTTRGARLATVRWDGVSEDYSLSEVTRVEQDSPGHLRFNDGKCDPQGNLWSGTMGAESSPGIPLETSGSIYSISSRDGSATRRYRGIGISNGMGWSSDATKYFYIDTSSLSVDVFDYDLANTDISNRRKVFDVAATRTPGLPDGMTIDSQGRIWAAMYFGGMVICIDPATGQLVETIYLPASNTTSCTFGGPNMDVLYVTSATAGLEPWQLRAQPDAGATFKVTGLGVKGTENVKWNVDYDALKSL